jgi:hypothetical protein
MYHPKKTKNKKKERKESRGEESRRGRREDVKEIGNHRIDSLQVSSQRRKNITKDS